LGWLIVEQPLGIAEASDLCRYLRLTSATAPKPVTRRHIPNKLAIRAKMAHESRVSSESGEFGKHLKNMARTSHNSSNRGEAE
jgi:hypothetical protein